MVKTKPDQKPRLPKGQQQSNPSNTQKQGFWQTKTGRVVIGGFITITVAIISIVGVVFVPPLNHLVNPTPIVSSNTFVVPSGTPYFYCVEWQQNKNYNIEVSTNEIPVDIFIINESTYLQYAQNNSIPISDLLYKDENTMGDSFSYSPPLSGMFQVVVVNSAAFKLSKNYVNQSATVNLTVEKYLDSCP